MNRQQLIDAGICLICEGRGKYMKRQYKDGLLEEWWVYCEPCEGTGYEQDTSDAD